MDQVSFSPPLPFPSQSRPPKYRHLCRPTLASDLCCRCGSDSKLCGGCPLRARFSVHYQKPAPGSYGAAKVKNLASRFMVAGAVQSDPYLAFNEVVNGWCARVEPTTQTDLALTDERARYRLCNSY
jgi:hypothetical protein